MAYRSGTSQSQEEPSFVDDFVEMASSQRQEIKRNYGLLQSLDKTYAHIMQEIAEATNKYLTEGKAKLEQRALQNPSGDMDVDPKMLVEKGNEKLRAKIEELQAKAKQIVEEKVAIAEQNHKKLQSISERMDAGILANFEQHLQRAGEFDGKGARPGDEVAILTENEDDWVLARVLDYRVDTGVYNVMDEDDNTKTYHLSEARVIPLENRTDKLSKGEDVVAVYPDTTSFYHGVVSVPPKRSALSDANTAMASISFADDADEYGVTPIRTVPMRHVLKASSLPNMDEDDALM